MAPSTALWPGDGDKNPNTCPASGREWGRPSFPEPRRAGKAARREGLPEAGRDAAGRPLGVACSALTSAEAAASCEGSETGQERAKSRPPPGGARRGEANPARPSPAQPSLSPPWCPRLPTARPAQPPLPPLCACADAPSRGPPLTAALARWQKRARRRRK